MYHALYRKWRPQKFADVVGQEPIVTALQNQIASGRIGHAYLFTGTRGTGKTTCAKIFAKAINCLDHSSPDPCGECEVCRGIDEGTVLDISEIDAASNNSVDDIRDLRDETAYTPSTCRYKVYIIDEVHMLSTAAFNALLKTLEEPPAHVIFILATTEIQKVPATIRSRCQRYDFTRISPEDIAGRVAQVAGAEGLSLTEGAAGLIARLADGALRDALSILDTCAGVTNQIDETVVRQMAGVTDRSYLFRMSDALSARDAASALAELAALRQQSVDIKRLTEELIAHYRSLMLAALPGGRELLSGVSPEEEALYLEKGPALGRREAVRAIRALGSALEHMARGSDQRIELELALFALTEPEAQAAAPAAQTAPAARPARLETAEPAAQPAVRPFASGPVASAPSPAPAAQPAQPAPSAQAAAQPAPAAEKAPDLPPWDDPQPVRQAPQSAPPAEALPWDEPAPPPPEPEDAYIPPEPPAPIQEEAAPAAQPAFAADPQLDKPRRVAGREINPYPQWADVVDRIRDTDPMLYGYLKKSKAYFDGVRVLIDGGKTFRDFIRVNKGSQRLIKKLIAEVSGIAVPIGPYEPEKAASRPKASAEESLHKLEALGLDITIDDGAVRRRS